jgi:lysine 2,3-aminomutase
MQNNSATTRHTGNLRSVQASTWREILSASITDPEALGSWAPGDPILLNEVAARYPMGINPYYLSLIKAAGDPIYRQVVPDPAELTAHSLRADPLAEEAQSPVPGLTHRYPDRAILLVSNLCAVYCRFCMRKRKVGHAAEVNQRTIDEGIRYIGKTRSIREVILTGGDPLLRSDAALERILSRLRRINHVEIIRIHSRVPCTLPQRITGDLAAMLKRFHPLYINTHFNHPRELTPEARRACAILADAGIPLGCQTVLLKGVNDDPEIMIELMRKLLTAHVRPYYLHHPDPVNGTAHFRVPVGTGLAIMHAMRGHISGMAVPQYMIDLPGGGGKTPLLPSYVKTMQEGHLQVVNYQGRMCDYPL